MASAQTGNTGTLKHIDLEQIVWDKRFRNDLGDIESLAESIRDKGIIQPVTVSTFCTLDGSKMPAGKYWLVAGERRCTAAEKAELKKVPALVRNISDAIDAREVEMVENLYRKNFTWAEEAIAIAEIDRLYKERDLDWSGRKTAELLDRSVSGVARNLKLAKAVGIMPELAEMKTADEAMKTLAKLEEKHIVEELHGRQVKATEAALAEVPTNGKVVSQEARALASMLRTADSNYHIGDVFLSLAELKSNGMVHVIECDPPYGIALQQVKSTDEQNIVKSYNEVDKEAYPEFLQKLTKELYRVAGPDCWMVFWFGPTWFTEVKAALLEAGWKLDDIPCIWFKTGTGGQTMQHEVNLARYYEPFFLCRKGQPVLLRRGRSNVFQYAVTPSTKKYHPTERPVPLIEEILTTLATPRQIVLVPFLGSGATLRAVYNSGMVGWGYDMSDEYKKRFMLAVEEDTKALSAQPTAGE